MRSVPEAEPEPYLFPAIVRLRDPRELAGYDIHPRLGAFCAYSCGRTQRVRESLGKGLRTPHGEVFAAVLDRVIVGFLLLVPPSPDQPWGRLCDPRILEIGIEVARDHRGHGVAQAMCQQAFARPEVEVRIHVATAYRWCWDVEGSGLSATAYADRLLKLFERFGFRREWTNEPNVMMEPANFLAVRIGREVSSDLLRRFRQTERGERAA
jgi:GNAT superfamily N-acetyltransferase